MQITIADLSWGTTKRFFIKLWMRIWFESLCKKLITLKMGAPDKPCGVGRADANPKLLLNDT